MDENVIGLNANLSGGLIRIPSCWWLRYLRAAAEVRWNEDQHGLVRSTLRFGNNPLTNPTEQGGTKKNRHTVSIPWVTGSLHALKRTTKQNKKYTLSR